MSSRTQVRFGGGLCAEGSFLQDSGILGWPPVCMSSNSVSKRWKGKAWVETFTEWQYDL